MCLARNYGINGFPLSVACSFQEPPFIPFLLAQTVPTNASGLSVISLMRAP